MLSQVGGDIINLRAVAKIGINGSVCPIDIGMQGRCYVVKYGFKIKQLAFACNFRLDPHYLIQVAHGGAKAFADGF
jgi:hypothetical protein